MGVSMSPALPPPPTVPKRSQSAHHIKTSIMMRCEPQQDQVREQRSSSSSQSQQKGRSNDINRLKIESKSIRSNNSHQNSVANSEPQFRVSLVGRSINHVQADHMSSPFSQIVPGQDYHLSVKGSCCNADEVKDSRLNQFQMKKERKLEKENSQLQPSVSKSKASKLRKKLRISTDNSFVDSVKQNSRAKPQFTKYKIKLPETDRSNRLGSLMNNCGSNFRHTQKKKSRLIPF